MSTWRHARTPDQRAAAVASALLKHGSLRAAARALGLSPGYLSRLLSRQRGKRVLEWQHWQRVQGVSQVVGEPLTERPRAPRLETKMERAHIETAEVVEMSRPITAKLSWDAWLLLSRVEVELRAHLRREPTRGEVIGMLLSLAGQVAGLAEDGSPRPAAIAEALVKSAVTSAEKERL